MEPSPLSGLREPEHLKHHHVVLALQAMPDKATRACIVAVRLTVLVSIAFLIFEVVAKVTYPPKYLFQRNTIAYINVAVASLCCAALLGTAIAFAARVGRAVRQCKAWLPYQKVLTGFAGAQVALTLINAAAYLVPNAYLLAHECSWFLLPNKILTFVRWTCCAALFFLMVLQAHSMLPAYSAVGLPAMRALAAALGCRLPEPPKGALVYQLPFWVHLPLALLLWAPAQATVVMLLLWMMGVVGGGHVCYSIADPLCVPGGPKLFVPCTRWGWNCDTESRGAFYPITATMGAILLLMLGVYFLLMRSVRRELAALPIQRVRMANLAARLQMQTQMVVAAFFLPGIGLSWYLKLASCSSYVLAWFGFPPIHLCYTVVAVVNALAAMPVEPSPSELAARRRRQRVEWLEDKGPGALEGGKPIRASSTDAAKHWQGTRALAAALGSGKAWLEGAVGIAGEDDRGEEQPAFCMETAIKCLHWAKLMYEYQELDELVEGVCSLDTALGLYGLKHHRLLWERSRKGCDTKCVVAWGEGTVLVAFRGTASLANVLADIKVWRAVHPPKRGTYLLGSCPLVHKGFLETYTAEGHNLRVLQLVRDIITDSCCDCCGGGGGDGAENRGGSAVDEGTGGGGSAAGGGTGGCCDACWGKTGKAGDGRCCCCSRGDGGSGDGQGEKGSPGGGQMRRIGDKDSQRRRWRVICTGHSLGGALATLASYDLTREAERLQQQCGVKVAVKLVTFGSPRPGNHAFARDFRRVVPDAWDVVHANDAVSKEGKFLFLYKRAASRVIVTAQGDMLPRPCFLEASLYRGPYSSLSQHLLSAYARSFAAAVRGQFHRIKAHSEASRAALRQLVACPFVRDVLLSQLHFRQRSLWRMRFNALPSEGAGAAAGSAQHHLGCALSASDYGLYEGLGGEEEGQAGEEEEEEEEECRLDVP